MTPYGSDVDIISANFEKIPWLFETCWYSDPSNKILR